MRIRNFQLNRKENKSQVEFILDAPPSYASTYVSFIWATANNSFTQLNYPT
jgi:hypothetical protein